jgi:hypothetical protein
METIHPVEGTPEGKAMNNPLVEMEAAICTPRDWEIF